MIDPPILTDRFNTALVLAHGLHRDQRKKSTKVPYMAHLLHVTSLVLEAEGDETTAIAALLHDVLEDAGTEHAAGVTALFGDDVLELVEACSEIKEDAAGRERSWRERKESYLARLADKHDSRAVLIALCDKVSNSHATVRNLRDVGPHDTWSRFNAGRDDQLWWYDSLLETFREHERAGRAAPWLVAELADYVEEMQRLG